MIIQADVWSMRPDVEPVTQNLGVKINGRVNA